MNKPADKQAIQQALFEIQDSFAESQRQPVIIPEYDDVRPCSECKHPMTDEERYFYSYRCESCEIEWHERIEAWRHRECEDEELNALYAAPEEPESTRH